MNSEILKSNDYHHAVFEQQTRKPLSPPYTIMVICTQCTQHDENNDPWLGIEVNKYQHNR